MTFRVSKAEALREHAALVELQRNARASTAYIERRQKELAAAWSAAELGNGGSARRPTR